MFNDLCLPILLLLLAWQFPVSSYSTDDADDTVQDIVYTSGSNWNEVFLHEPPIREVRMDEIIEVHMTFSTHFVTGNWQGTREGFNFPVTSRRYDKMNPGYTFAIRKGTTFKFRLVNDLEGAYGPNTDDLTCNIHEHVSDMISYKCMNHTNVHWHGLTIDPRRDHDDVTLIDIAPGESFTYTVNIMQDHNAGTYWYHPHRHGSAALQVASGAYGAAIIMDDPISEEMDPDLIRFLEFEEHTIFLSYHYLELYEYIHLLKTSGVSTWEVDLYNAQISNIFNYTGNAYVTLTNGQFRPGIEIVEKTYYRWRIIMAPVIFINVSFFPLWDFGANCTVNIVARDGVYYDLPDQIFDNAPQLFSSGNRIDAVIYCDSVPDKEEYIWDIAGNTTFDESDYLNAFFIPVFKKCSNCTSDGEWEGTLPKRPEYMAVAEAYDYTNLEARRVTWDFNYRSMGDQPHYPNYWWSINKQAFNATHTLPDEDTQEYSPDLPLNSFEIWRIETWENLGHVFHLHTNHFMVLDYFIANQHDVDLGRSWDQLVGRWMDNVMVPLGSDRCHTGVEDHYDFDPVGIASADNDTCIPGFVEILVHFYKYPGQRIFHCHFLNHEDHGMMSFVNVCEQEETCVLNDDDDAIATEVSEVLTTIFESSSSLTETQWYIFGIIIGASVVFGALLFYYVCCRQKLSCCKSEETPYIEVNEP